MSSLKQVRGQLRQITKEILPEVLNQELSTTMHKNLTKLLETRLTHIENYIKGVLESIDQRTKDTQSYLIRQVTSPQIPAPQEVDTTLLPVAGAENEAK